MDTKIDIENYNDFIDAGFIECKKCGWAFDPKEYEKHDCMRMRTAKKYPSDDIKMPRNK